MPRRVARVAAYGNQAAHVQPAHIGGGRTVHDDFRVVEAHGADTLARIRHMEDELFPFGMPERPADVMLARRDDLELRLAFLHRLFHR